MSHFDKLTPTHNLFTTLRSDNPQWWQLLKSQPDCYIDIRKDNTINVYYNGGSLFKISYRRGYGYNVKIHPAYLGQKGNKYVPFPNYASLDQPKLKEIKDNIASRFGHKSESGLKAQMMCATGSIYIDTEFAFTEPDENNPKKSKIIRIDLVRLNGKTIEFVELKRISDGRLLKKESYGASKGDEEILEQVKKYNKFLNDNKDEIIKYYKNLLKIKSDLDLLPASLKGRTFDKDTCLDLLDKVVLFIAKENYEDRVTEKRKERRKVMRNLLKSHNVSVETDFTGGL